MPPDMGCEQPRTEAEELAFSVTRDILRDMLYFDTRFEPKNHCERYTRELESAAEAGCGYAWLLLGWFFSEQPSAFRCSTEVPTVEECFKKAELYYKKAIEAGENAARTLLGKLYIFGCGSARVYSENRVEEALEQLELAAEGGDASAAELLAAVYGNDVYDESPFDVLNPHPLRRKASGLSTLSLSKTKTLRCTGKKERKLSAGQARKAESRARQTFTGL